MVGMTLIRPLNKGQSIRLPIGYLVTFALGRTVYDDKDGDRQTNAVAYARLLVRSAKN